jgi:nifR3 family TIM-barrel protein
MSDKLNEEGFAKFHKEGSANNANFFREQLAKNDLVAAPMAGITSAPFRLILRDFFDGLTYTEMVSVEGVKRDNPFSTEYLDILPTDRPVVVQLFGGNPESYPEAAAVAERYSNPDAFDINMGCPMKKVVKTGGGSALLRDLPNVKAIISTMRRATKKPFSVKIRVGWDDNTPVYKEILDIAQSEGADALILHGRTRNQMFGGEIHYYAIEELVARATIPIIGNGNVVDYESYMRMKATGVDGVMIGRGMMNAPWIFKAIREQKSPQDYLTPPEMYDLLIKLYKTMTDHASANPNKQGHYLNIIKKYAVWFSKGMEDAANFRVNVYKSQDEESFMRLMEFFRQ